MLIFAQLLRFASSLFCLAVALVTVLLGFSLGAYLKTQYHGALLVLFMTLLIVGGCGFLYGLFNSMWNSVAYLMATPFFPFRRRCHENELVYAPIHLFFGYVPLAITVYVLFVLYVPDTEIFRFWQDIPVMQSFLHVIEYPTSWNPDVPTSVAIGNKVFEPRTLLRTHWKSHVGFALVLAWGLVIFAAILIELRRRMRIGIRIHDVLCDPNMSPIDKAERHQVGEPSRLASFVPPLFFFSRFGSNLLQYGEPFMAFLFGSILVVLGLWPGLLLLLAGFLRLNFAIWRTWRIRKIEQGAIVAGRMGELGEEHENRLTALAMGGRRGRDSAY